MLHRDAPSTLPATPRLWRVRESARKLPQGQPVLQILGRLQRRESGHGQMLSGRKDCSKRRKLGEGHGGGRKVAEEVGRGQSEQECGG